MQRRVSFDTSDYPWRSCTSTDAITTRSTSSRGLSPDRIDVDYNHPGSISTTATRTTRAASAMAGSAQYRPPSRGLSPNDRRSVPIDYSHPGTLDSTALTVTTTTAPHFATQRTIYVCACPSGHRPSREVSPPRSSRQAPD